MKTGFSKLTLACATVAVLASSGVALAADIRVGGNGTNAIAVNAPAQDNAAEGAQNFISSMGDRGINFLGNQSMSIESKKAEFRSLLNESFDMNTIGRFALGTYWKSATPAQQQEYLKLFNTMIVKVYSKRFSDYKGQKFVVKSSRKENDKDYIVTSFIVPGDGPQVRVDWRVRNKGGSYRVVDIIVEGVSMSQTQRADFASVINRGGGKVDVLLNHLRQQ
jgi:phospholipid transport system substrate-binding protein